MMLYATTRKKRLAMFKGKWIHIRKFLLICCLSLVTLTFMTIYCGYFLSFTNINRSTVFLISKKKQGLLVDTPGCKIPYMDPNDSSIAHLLQKHGPLQCPGPPPLVLVNRTTYMLTIDTSVLNKHYGGHLNYCQYQAFYRDPKEASDWAYIFNKTTIKFDLQNPQVIVNDEFIRVDCFDANKTIIYYNFHIFILSKPSVIKRMSDNFKQCTECKKNSERLNVLIFAMDSTSRLNLIRMCPKTVDYITKTMDAIDFKGYNKVADNTFVNLVPLFTGKFVEELPWNETLKKKPFDEYDFLWKNYTKHGYATLFAEDQGEISTFTYLKTGFYKQPCDYYLRPFNLVLERSGLLKKGNGQCLGEEPEPKVIFNWILDFMKLYRKEGFFAFTFLSRMSHDYLGDAAMADEPYKDIFVSLHESGILNNTFLIFMSDHGLRFGDIRKTYIGKLEERLPFLFFILPSWFGQKYPVNLKNLQLNSERLITHFDVFETLLHVLHFENIPKTDVGIQRAYSLFSEVPDTRTCNDAAVLPHWCTCQEYTKKSVMDPKVIKVSEFIINHINNLIKEYSDICLQWTLDKTTDARVSSPHETILTFKQSLNDVINRQVFHGNRANSIINYYIMLIAKPDDAWFEATVQYTEATNKHKVLGDISRVNMYGNQSECISKHKLKKFCYCKKIS